MSTSLPTDRSAGKQPDPAVVEFARGIGIDLINGEHEPITAEAARRSGLDLLAFPRWKRAEVDAHTEAMRALAEEQAQAQQRIQQVVAAMEEHGAEYTRDVPLPVLCRIFNCSPEGLDAAIEATIEQPWWSR